MRGLALSLLFVILMLSCVAQTGKSDTATKSVMKTPDFTNEGEQEYWWAEQAFTKNYKPQPFTEYKGTIIANGNTFTYDEQVIEVYASQEIKSLFKKGVFYPSLILYADNGLPRSLKIRIPKDTTQRSLSNDTVSAVKNLKSVFNPDSLVVSAFEELKRLEASARQRRFRFLLYTKGFLYPTLYFVELTNNQATLGTDLTTFLKNVRITFLRKGSVLI